MAIGPRGLAPSRALPLALSLLPILFVADTGWAQQPDAASSARVYRPNIAEEDWSFLQDPALRTDPFDPVKYIPFREGRSFLTLGGEVRIRPEGFRVHGPGGTTARDNYLFQRYLFATDWHVGKGLRVFGEVQSGLIGGKGGSPRPTDKNTVDLHQGFVEYQSPRGRPRQLTVRVGRQELAIAAAGALELDDQEDAAGDLLEKLLEARDPVGAACKRDAGQLRQGPGGDKTEDPSVQRFPLARVLEESAALVDGTSSITRRRIKLLESVEGVLGL